VRHLQRQLDAGVLSSLGDLVAGVAHEMNTPIGTATSAGDVSVRCVERLETMLREAESIDAMRASDQLPKVLRILKDSVRVSRDAGDRIGAIVQSLKNFARLDEAEYQEADIHEGIDSTLTLMNAELLERVTVNRNYGEIPKIACNPGQLNQVFLNLLKNAANAIETSGTIDVTTFEKDGQVHVEISDTGRGIPRHRLDRLFDFFAAAGTRVKMSSGLSTAYSIIQKHDGEIDIDSEEGKGTRVTLILPVNRS